MAPASIFKTKYGYVIKGKELSITWKSILVTLEIGLIVFLISSFDFGNIKPDLENGRKICFIAVLAVSILSTVFHEKRITINFPDGKITFIDGIKPFRNEVSVDINKVKCISINCVIEKGENSEIQFFNVDLIDRQFNAYQCCQSAQYEGMLRQFSEDLSAILQVPVEDKADTDGYGNVYRQRLF